MRARLDTIEEVATGWLDYSPASSQTRAPTKMADLLVATTTLENKKGEKVNASEALKGKVVALYVRLTLSRTTSPAVAAAPAPAESASPCARQLTCSRSAAGSSPRTGARPAAVRAARSNHAATAQHQRSTRLDEALCARLSLAASALPPQHCPASLSSAHASSPATSSESQPQILRALAAIVLRVSASRPQPLRRAFGLIRSSHRLIQPTAAAACISTLLPTQRSALLPLARAHPQPLRS